MKNTPGEIPGFCIMGVYPKSQLGFKYYRYYLKKPYETSYIPIFVIDVPEDASTFRNSVGCSDDNIGLYDFISSNLLPYWQKTLKSGQTSIKYLEVYEDDIFFIYSPNDTSFNVSVKDNTGTVFTDTFPSEHNTSYACFFPIYGIFVHTTDDQYYGVYQSGGGGVSYGIRLDYISDVSSFVTETIEVDPQKNKGTIKLLGSRSTFFPKGSAYSVSTPDSRVRNAYKSIIKKSKLIDEKDPFNGGGSSHGSGGDDESDGGGSGNIGGDSNGDDGLPTISALDSGLLTAYNPSESELQALGRFLWSDSFDVTSFKKLFNDPFDTLLGLSVIPIKPKTSESRNIMFGNLDSGVPSNVISSQWVSKDMGSVTLNEVWRGALDYSPSTGVSIYLPFIGMRQLNTNDVMGSTIHLMYKFDVLTGTCVAQLYVNHNAQGNKDDGFSWNKNQGLLYEFMGQCSVNIPLASQDFTNTIRAAIGAVGMAAGAATSVATGNPAIGIVSLTVGAANAGMQANTPTVERSGHLSGSGSILGYYQPFLVVERPHQCKPERYYSLRGIPSQVYVSKLSECTGFTQITDNNNIHASGAQDVELEEIERLLTSGVYFPNKKR